MAVCGPDPDADRDDRLAEADDHERPVALSEVSDGDPLQATQALARQPRRPGVIDRRGDRPQQRAMPAVQKHAPDDQQDHADHNRDREPDDRAAGGIALPRGVDVKREVEHANQRVGDREQRPLAPERLRQRQTDDEDQHGPAQQGGAQRV
jgi:hypothetical protein